MWPSPRKHRDGHRHRGPLGLFGSAPRDPDGHTAGAPPTAAKRSRIHAPAWLASAVADRDARLTGLGDVSGGTCRNTGAAAGSRHRAGEAKPIGGNTRYPGRSGRVADTAHQSEETCSGWIEIQIPPSASHRMTNCRPLGGPGGTMTNVMPRVFVRMSGREPGRRSIMSCPRVMAWTSPVSGTTPLLRILQSRMARTMPTPRR